VPEPGPQPTLDDMLADIERQRLFRIIEDLVLWENTTNETVLQAARDEIWQSWRRACAENADHPRAKELFDRTSCPPSTTPSPAAARCRWRRSGSGWRATPAT
jgi:putative DNA methylase